MFPRTGFGSAVSDIQSLLGDADPTSAGLDDATRAWLLDTRQVITAQRRGPGRRRAWAPVPRRARGPGWRVLAAAGALAVAAGLAGGLLAAPLAGSRPARGGHAKLSLTAAQFLNHAAAAAARQPALNVRDGQYMYIASMDRWASTTAAAGGGDGPTVVEPLHKREIWLSVSDVCKPGLLKDPSPGHAMKLHVTGISCPNRGGWGDPTYRFLQSLPADPRTLLHMIYAATKGRGQGPNLEAFTTIGIMLREAIAPPDVSAALYRAAALIPRVRVIPHVTDILGQSGIGVQLARRVTPSPPSGVPHQRSLTWIFNPTTLLWMGEADGIVHGKLMGSVVLRRAIVDRLGQLPGGQ
jgi:hypothetical protein